MRRTTTTALPPVAPTTLAADARCAVCGLTEQVFLRTRRFGSVRVTLCPDAECSVRYQASQPAMLAEALAILATTRTRSLRT